MPGMGRRKPGMGWWRWKGVQRDASLNIFSDARQIISTKYDITICRRNVVTGNIGLHYKEWIRKFSSFSEPLFKSLLLSDLLRTKWAAIWVPIWRELWFQRHFALNRFCSIKMKFLFIWPPFSVEIMHKKEKKERILKRKHWNEI